ncbi:hypothetical protein D3C76_1164010 [compost metagenome]
MPLKESSEVIAVFLGARVGSKLRYLSVISRLFISLLLYLSMAADSATLCIYRMGLVIYFCEDAP